MVGLNDGCIWKEPGADAMNEWNEAEQRVEKAREFFEQRRWPEALVELRAAIVIDPYNSGWLFNIGLILDEMERFDEAIAAYRQSLELEGDDIEALNRLGIDLAREGHYSQALEAFERIQALDASFEPAYCHRIALYAELRDHEKAEEMFYTARLYREQCPHCYYNIGVSLAGRGLFDKAIYCWQKTLDLDDHYPQVHLRLAEAFGDQGRPETARQHYLMELRRNPGDIDTLLDLGGLLMEMGRIQDGGEKFRHAVELCPEHPAAHYCLGQWLMETGSDRQAIAAFGRALRLDPTCTGAHLCLGKLYQARGRRQRALRHLREECLLAPEDPRILLELSNTLLDMGECRLAVMSLQRLTTIDPVDAGAWQNLAVAWFMGGSHDQGVAASRQALRLDPRHRQAMHNLAVACERRGRYLQALAWVRRALAINPRDRSFQKLELRLHILRFRGALCGALRRLSRRRQGRN